MANQLLYYLRPYKLLSLTSNFCFQFHETMKISDSKKQQLICRFTCASLGSLGTTLVRLPMPLDGITCTSQGTSVPFMGLPRLWGAPYGSQCPGTVDTRSHELTFCPFSGRSFFYFFKPDNFFVLDLPSAPKSEPCTFFFHCPHACAFPSLTFLFN